MHLLMLAIFAVVTSAALGQTGGLRDSSPAASQQTGRTDLGTHQQHIEQQPQGSTGPLDTTAGGAPAESPQGQTPPGMQAAPEGSSKTITEGK